MFRQRCFYVENDPFFIDNLIKQQNQSRMLYDNTSDGQTPDSKIFGWSWSRSRILRVGSCFQFWVSSGSHFWVSSGSHFGSAPAPTFGSAPAPTFGSAPLFIEKQLLQASFHQKLTVWGTSCTHFYIATYDFLPTVTL